MINYSRVDMFILLVLVFPGLVPDLEQSNPQSKQMHLDIFWVTTGVSLARHESNRAIALHATALSALVNAAQVFPSIITADTHTCSLHINIYWALVRVQRWRWRISAFRICHVSAWLDMDSRPVFETTSRYLLSVHIYRTIFRFQFLISEITYRRWCYELDTAAKL